MKRTKLKSVILETGITQRHIARRSGIHETTLSLIANGRYIPDERQKKAIADALGKPETELFKGVN